VVSVRGNINGIYDVVVTAKHLRELEINCINPDVPISAWDRYPAIATYPQWSAQARSNVHLPSRHHAAEVPQFQIPGRAHRAERPNYRVGRYRELMTILRPGDTRHIAQSMTELALT
jgi:hypothetical protein